MEGAYVWVMVHYLPPSLRGLMLAGFAAAYMSTVGTHLNLGASYMVNDLYKRFLAPDRSEHHYVAATRIATILVAVMSAAATGYMLTHGASIATAWKFLLSLGAGAGLVFILRWYWWRINAWSEIAAMTAAATISLTLESGWGMPIVRALHRLDPALALAPLNQDDPHAFAWLMLTTTLLTTAIWLAVTLATQPETDPTLQAFYDRVRPAALGWRSFAQSSGCPIHRAVVLRDGWESSPPTRESQPKIGACHSDPERSEGEESPHLARAVTNPSGEQDSRHSVRSTESPSLAPTARPIPAQGETEESPHLAPTARPIPAQGVALGTDGMNDRGLKARPISPDPVDNCAPASDPQHDPGFPASLLAGVDNPTLRYNFFHWILGFTLVYAMLFGVGDLLFARIAPGCALLTLSAACLAILFFSLNRRGWSVWR